MGTRYPELDDDKGISLLLINTQKGQKLLENCKLQIFIKECDLEYAIKYNLCITGSVKPHPAREQFFKDLDNLSFDRLIKKYMSLPNVLKRVKGKVWGMLSRVKRRIFK